MKYKTEDERRAAHLEQATAYRRKYPDRVRAAKENWRKKNMDSYRAYALKQRAQFPDRVKSAWKRWADANSVYLNAKKAERMAKRKMAMPAWANPFFIEEIYDLARRRTIATGFPWHVDHIVPTISHLVCGLHTERNLRVIPGKENQSKKNFHWPDMPS